MFRLTVEDVFVIRNRGVVAKPASYPRHRFPAEIISHAVWLYHVFSLSLRDVELILAERGVVVTHESIRHWCLKFGADFAEEATTATAAARGYLASR